MKDKKKQVGIILGIIVVIIAIVAGIIVISNKSAPSRELSKALDLGNKYLTELNYEEAVIAFNRAIEIDPMNVDAYVGVADAYIGLTNQNKPDDAEVNSARDEMISNLDPYNVSDGSEEKAKIESFYASALKYCEDALAILNSGYELTHDESIKAKIDELAELQSAITKMRDDMINELISAIGMRGQGIDDQGFKVFGLSIYDLAKMTRSEMASYFANNYGVELRYESDERAYDKFSIYSDRPLDDNSPTWHKKLDNIEYNYYDPDSSHRADFYYGNSIDYKCLIMNIIDGQGAYIYVYPDPEEIRQQMTIPENFPPLNQGIDGIEEYCKANGIVYYGDDISIPLPSENAPDGYNNAIIHFNINDEGVLQIQLGITTQ